jgi:hypothetical protein
MSNMHPADELAWLRAEIRRLTRREAELRARFVAGKADREGTEASVTVRRTRRCIFRRERLPAHVLADPGLWDETAQPTVLVKSRRKDRLVPAPRPADVLTLVT